jgi:1-acyl-sn-glycerol-3-phosphate acyltransferase
MDSWFYLRIILLVLRARIMLRFARGDKRFLEKRALTTLRLIEYTGTPVRIEGIELVRELDEPVVFVANHMSLIETFVLPTLLIREFQDVCTVIKSSLARYPAFGPIISSLDPIQVDRKDARRDLKTVLDDGKRALEDGRSVLIFPQATRSEVFVPSSFNTLGVKLAERAGVPVMPVAVKTDFYGIGKRSKDFGPLHRGRPVNFRFGKPVRNVNGKAAQKEVLEFITASLREWGVPVEEK